MKSLPHTVRAAALAGAALVLTAPASASLDLGEAGQFAVLGFRHVDMTFSSGNTYVTGHVGIGPGGRLDFSGGGVIDGNLYHHYNEAANINISGGSTVTGLIIERDMGIPGDDALAAAAFAAGLSSTQNVLGLGNGDTLTGGGGLNVIDVSGDIALSGGGVLTLEGGADDIFVINVHGNMELSGGSAIALGGDLDASRVLFNFLGAGQDVSFSGNSDVRGTILAPDRDLIVSGGTVTGALLGGGKGELKLQSGPTVTYEGFNVPAPGALALLGLGGIIGRRRRRG